VFFKLWEYLADKDISDDEKRKTLKMVSWVVLPLLMAGLLFLIAVLLGLIHL